MLAGLDLADARAAYRAIAQANPGGLGSAPEQDVHEAPTLRLREAMALAASRDSIARQYANGHAELFDVGLAALPPGFVLMEGAASVPPSDATTAAVQRVYLRYLRVIPDSHIVRKHGEAVGTHCHDRGASLGWVAAPDRDPAFAAWDESLKAQGINPGTSADLTRLPLPSRPDHDGG